MNKYFCQHKKEHTVFAEFAKKKYAHYCPNPNMNTELYININTIHMYNISTQKK